MKIPEPSLKPFPKRAYDRTPEENDAIVRAEVKAFLAPKVPKPKLTYTPKEKKWAISMLSPNISKVCHQTINAKLKGKVTWPRQKEAGNKFPSLENKRINRSPCS
jgi:hypothetical protein